GEDGAKLQVALISVDPERDLPERLATYARSFDPSFVALRPEPAELEQVTQSFRAIAIKVPLQGAGDDAIARGEYTVDHSGTLYVYDRANRLRLITQPTFDVQQFTADLQRLAREPV
ncbi:MAG: SCO family protein, partial [Steroidobacteraceae bacterium]